MKPEPMTDEQIAQVLIPYNFPEGTNPVVSERLLRDARAIEAAVNAKWQAMLAAQPAPKQEPIGYVIRDSSNYIDSVIREQDRIYSVPVYLEAQPVAPQQGDTHHWPQQGDMTWQAQPASQQEPLTHEEIKDWWASENGLEDCELCHLVDFAKAVRAVEEKHGIGKAQPVAQPVNQMLLEALKEYRATLNAGGIDFPERLCAAIEKVEK